ncbi:MAG: class I SAM-dependent methyltransferase [Flavobacteriales bacterium]
MHQRMPKNSTRPNPRKDPRWVEARFDRIAPWYSVIEPLFLVPQEARRKAIASLDMAAGQNVLSVGCGSGRSLMQLAGIVGTAGCVTGIDLSSRMLQQARTRLGKARVANVALCHSDLFSMGQEIRYDRIFFEFSLSSFGNPQAAINKARELLMPDGKIVVLDGRVPPRFLWLTKPAMPAIRWILENTVLGDPDMDAASELERTGLQFRVEWFRGKTYFVATLSPL